MMKSAVAYQVAEFTSRHSCGCATGPKRRINRSLMRGLMRREISHVQADAAKSADATMSHSRDGSTRKKKSATAPEPT